MEETPKSSRGGSGPFTSQLPLFRTWLENHGYRPSTIKQYLRIGERFDALLACEGIDLDRLEPGHVDEYAARLAGEARRRNAKPKSIERFIFFRGTLRRLWECLEEAELVCRPWRTAAPVDEGFVAEYLEFLRHHRGLSEKTIRHRRLILTRFLDHLGIGVTACAEELNKISAAQIDRFLVQTAEGKTRSTMNSVCVALRGFFGHLKMRGVITSDLRRQVMLPRIYRLEGLPRSIRWEDVERTLAAVDRDTVQGARDYAILALLAYCGLRASEVAALCLEDIDWSHDTIRFRRAKGGAADAIPILPAVGEALVAYLRCRPQSPQAEGFLKVIAPAGPMNGPCITFVARKYLLAAGVEAPRLGAHTYRHSYAVSLVRKGFPLKTIGDTLGHNCPQSTFIYTKVAVEDLREVALEVTEVLP